MPRALTEREREDFLADIHVATLSVASDDDRPPLTVPVWYGYQRGGNLTFFTGTFGRKARKTGLLEGAGVVSMSVQREEYPYKYVTVEGTVVGADRSPSRDQMLAIADRYLPDEAAQGFVTEQLDVQDSQLVLFTIRPDRWLTHVFD